MFNDGVEDAPNHTPPPFAPHVTLVLGEHRATIVAAELESLLLVKYRLPMIDVVGSQREFVRSSSNNADFG
jgi:hypothetical protein